MSDVDIQIWLEGDIYLNVDKMSTAAGLEIRMPLTDRRMLLILHQECRPVLKSTKSRTKWHSVPQQQKYSREEIAFRKLGFIVPIRIWMADARYNQDVQRLFHSEIAERNSLIANAINEVFDDYVKTIQIWKNMN